MSKIGIVILNYMNYSMTIYNVNRLIQLGITYPIVIVDNSSPNDSFDKINAACGEYPNVNLIKSLQNNGYSSGNNLGIDYIRTKFPHIEYICIMNPDVEILCQEVFKELVLKLEEQKLSLIAPIQLLNNQFNLENIGWKLPDKIQLIFDPSAIMRKIFNNTYEGIDLRDIKNGSMEIEVVPGSMFLVKLDAFKIVDIFDENVFLYFEENILATKLKENGAKIGVSLEHFYIHNHEHKIMDYKDKRKYNKIFHKSRVYFCEKYMNFSFFDLFLLNSVYFIHQNIEEPIIYILKWIKKVI